MTAFYRSDRLWNPELPMNHRKDLCEGSGMVPKTIRQSDGLAYGECPECGRVIRTRNDGRVRQHRR